MLSVSLIITAPMDFNRIRVRSLLNILKSPPFIFAYKLLKMLVSTFNMAYLVKSVKMCIYPDFCLKFKPVKGAIDNKQKMNGHRVI